MQYPLTFRSKPLKRRSCSQSIYSEFKISFGIAAVICSFIYLFSPLDFLDSIYQGCQLRTRKSTYTALHLFPLSTKLLYKYPHFTHFLHQPLQPTSSSSLSIIFQVITFSRGSVLINFISLA